MRANQFKKVAIIFNNHCNYGGVHNFSIKCTLFAVSMRYRLHAFGRARLITNNTRDRFTSAEMTRKLRYMCIEMTGDAPAIINESLLGKIF